jgi:hypothetical protein
MALTTRSTYLRRTGHWAYPKATMQFPSCQILLVPHVLVGSDHEIEASGFG